MDPPGEENRDKIKNTKVNKSADKPDKVIFLVHKGVKREKQVQNLRSVYKDRYLTLRSRKAKGECQNGHFIKNPIGGTDKDMTEMLHFRPQHSYLACGCYTESWSDAKAAAEFYGSCWILG